SNFSQLLANTYADVKEYNGLQDVHLISGGVFGHNISGYSYTNAGAQYIDDTYNEGINVVGSFAYTKSHWGTYPLDGIGQHIYIDQGGVTTSSAYQQYLNWVRQAYTKYEGTGTSKHTFVTETGWQTTGSETQSMQDQNLVTAFSVFEDGSANFVQTAIWFNWQDNPPGNQWYGVLDQYGSHKMSYNDYTFWEAYEGYNADGSINTAIQNYYKSYGQAALGDPYDNGGSPFVHTWSGGGFTAQVQDCDGGSHNRLCIFSSSAGTYEVNNGFWTTYLNNGGIGYYGAPTDNAYGYAGGTRQDFQSGHYLTWTSSGGVVSH
ncbi:MAG: hypothetical protein LC772_02215, partial [Chloroflexi bacterium]|nr:hypothetical protein [Chloroflexota bacterium]